jgi:hypothetical protein
MPGKIAKTIAAYREEAARLIQAVVEPRSPKETIKSRIGRTAKTLGWNFSRTRKIWHRIARRIDAHEMDQLRELDVERKGGNAPGRVPERERNVCG